MTRALRLLMSCALAALALGLAACGGDDEGGGDRAKNEQGTPAQGKQGGRATMLLSTDVDFLDPGKTYFTIGYSVTYPTQRPLYSFQPGKLEPVPDLAEGEPEISEDRKQVTVRIRRGVKFSPPVNREVTSADVKYAFERFFTENVAGAYGIYFNSIEGAPEEPGDLKEIPGIETPDEQTIVFKLGEPSGVSFAAALVMPITVPVPKEYAQKFDRKSPSTYNENVVFTGPYMVKNNSEGRLTGYKPAKSIELVRNPNWDRNTDYKPAYLDSVFIRTNASDAEVAARQTLNGSKLLHNENPPANILKTAATEFKDQYKRVPSGGFRYFPLNTTVKPFDDLNVRKAVLASFNREAVRLARGGRFVGEIPTHFLPPGIPGHEESNGAKGFGQDYLANPKGNPQLAAEYMKKAGYESGKYDGDEEFTLVTANVDPGKAQAEVAQAEFEKLGFKVKLRTVPQDAVYTEYCQQPDRNLFSCGSAGWFKDFTDPQSMLEPTFSGDAINEDGANNNLAELDVPEINQAMKEAAALIGDERNKRWAEINKMIVDQAPAVPFLWDVATLLHSRDVQGVANEYYDAWDVAFTSLG